jgi:hypothetical protein
MEPSKETDKGIFSVEQLMKSRPSNLHKGSSGSRSDDSCDIGKMIDDNPCAKQYYLLEECLGEHDRRWAKCQDEVKNLKVCAASKK